MAGDPAELAFGHCLAVLGDSPRATNAAATALRRAGRSRSLVLAHARHQALIAWDEGEWPEPTALPADPAQPSEVARALAATKPAAERAVLDLRNRTGTDRAALGRAVGATPTVASLRASDIAEEWDRDLDPALLALLGPGDCVDLAGVLSDSPSETVGDLLAVAPIVRAHADECEGCGDRVRAMASVRTLFSRDTGPVPDDVRTAARVSRRRRPSAVPPPLFGLSGVDRARRRLPVAVAAVAAIALVAFAWAAWPDGDEARQVEALTKMPRSASTIRLGAAATAGRVTTVALENAADRDLTWRAEISVAWAEARPARGTVERLGSSRIVVALLDAAPEGDVRAKLTVTASDGSSAITELSWTVEREPQVAATVTGCDVKVNVVEDGELAALVLHWRDSTEHQAPLAEGPDGYSATLPAPAGAPLTWWVTARDARGNAARSGDAVLSPGAC